MKALTAIEGGVAESESQSTTPKFLLKKRVGTHRLLSRRWKPKVGDMRANALPLLLRGMAYDPLTFHPPDSTTILNDWMNMNQQLQRLSGGGHGSSLLSKIVKIHACRLTKNIPK